MRMRVGPRFVAVLGECLALTVAGRFLENPLNEALAVRVGQALVVGTPLSIPWLVGLLMDWSSPNRVLTLLEVLFYGALMVYQVLLAIFLPKAMVASEGFLIIPFWGVSVLVVTIVPILSWHGRKRAKRTS